jgi:hypothetical protein
MMLLSGISMWPHSGLLPLVATMAATPSSTASRVFLNGMMSGLYSAEQQVPDIGTSYHVITSGRFIHNGKAAVDGDLHSLGFIARGQAGGTLTAITPHGALTLELTGPTQPGFSPLPTHFQFTITGGTGRYHHAQGSGTVDVALTPATNSSTSPSTLDFGRVTLTFHSFPPPVA